MNTNSRNVTYSTVGDYQLPNLTLNQPRKPLGKYGRLRRTYLKEQRPVLYHTMLLNGSLYPHLMEVEQTAESQMQQTMQGLLKQNPAPNKEQHQMGWVQHMNSLKAQAEELVLNELINSKVSSIPTFPPKPSKLKRSTKRRAKKRPPLLFCRRRRLKMRCGEVPMLKAANFGYGKFISCSLTENSGQKLLPTNMHRMAPAVLHTLIWTGTVVGLTMTARV